MTLSSLPASVGLSIARKWAEAWARGEPFSAAILIVGPPEDGKSIAAITEAIAEHHGWSLVDATAATFDVVATSRALDDGLVLVRVDDAHVLTPAEQRAVSEGIVQAGNPIVLTAPSPHVLVPKLRAALTTVAAVAESLGGGGSLDERLERLRAGETAHVAPGEYGQVAWWLWRAGRNDAAAEWDYWWSRYRRVGRPVERALLRVLRR